MARCKCLVCGASLDTTIAYRVEVIVKRRNGEKEIVYKYCCSQKEYDEYQKRKQKAKEDSGKVLRLVAEIMGVDVVTNGLLFTQKKVWNQAFSDDIIAKYLEKNKEYLTSTITKLTGKESSKIMYLSAILKNNLGDFKVEMRKQRVEEIKTFVDMNEMMYEIKYNHCNKRRSLSDLEDEI